MKSLSLALTLFMVLGTFSVSANTLSDTSYHKGFMLGLAFGVGKIHLSSHPTDQNQFILSLPNIKAGYWLNPQTSIHFLMPGAVYDLKVSDRIFEAFQIGASRWISPRWWVMGATGLTFDAGAFYTVSKLSEIKANTGLPSFSLGTGYECWSYRRYGIDFQYRFFYGRFSLGDGNHRSGTTHTLLAGINLY